MKTRTDIIKMALQILGVIGAGQTVEAEDHDTVLGVMSGTIATLEQTKVGSFVSYFEADEFPDEIFLPIATCVARDAASPYGFSGADLIALQERGADAEAIMSSMNSLGRGEQPMTAEYF